jgi:hypothetical protein
LGKNDLLPNNMVVWLIIVDLKTQKPLQIDYGDETGNYLKIFTQKHLCGKTIYCTKLKSQYTKMILNGIITSKLDK